MQKWKRFVYFASSSFLSSVVDVLVFQLGIIVLKHTDWTKGRQIFIATVISWTISCLVNYIVNRILVFERKASVQTSSYKYMIVIILQMLLSIRLVIWVHSLVGGPPVIAKMLVDSTLFLLSYTVQKRWVFRSN